ncbi:TetR/AcrR family transcriptional regulator [Bacillus sp. DTU_2020_1000418_1_SI_GHA_SEK_038]|uniref:TetR/AcrR family transcriptional regulator n=1 Tax=Bacillus sp. DTU_2020_1000418_1_SI_GHA_SEK_038 TaxID=3077585 RepID=UPI0028E3298D|nr:TetR/AcrR family transcriptional regulator [Bacillus sp. DTU_2020_1000418_1_SI_GHA_SEK_038]WNS75775.1 TetR/AcrR family transcriptional regulator [Bacillus sp. DTU_2020_1000418_1_SI_GHA_SEK_038]
MTRRMKIDLAVILLKATQLIDEQGLEKLSLGMLAEELQIRPPSLYNHLNGLNELKQKLAIHGSIKLYETMLQAAAGRSGDDAVKALSEAYIQFVRNHPGLYEATFRFSDTDDKELQEAQESIVRLAVQVLQVYNLEEEQAIHMVRGFRSILHGFASIEQMGGFGLPYNTDKSLSILIDTFIKGIHSYENEKVNKDDFRES